MKALKKLLAFAIAIALCFSLPSVAFAADPPVLMAATVTSDGHVELTFSKEMAAPPAGDAGFAVAGMFGQNKNVQSATLHPTDNTKIILTLGITVKGGEGESSYPFVSYVPGTVQSADGGQLAAITLFSISNPLPHPTLGTTPMPEGTVGSPYSYTFTATGGTLPYYFFTLYGALPPGLSLNNTTGELSGTPTASGTYGSSEQLLRIEVLDANQALDVRNITIVINAASGPSLPTVITNTVTGISTTGATLSGEMTDDGGATDTERGFVYALNANPTTSDTHVVVGSGEGIFSSTLSGLSSGTTYHVRAYATNSAGTSYGEDTTFTTVYSSNNGSSTPTYYVPNSEVTEPPKTGDAASSTGFILLGLSALCVCYLTMRRRKA
jgi:LPXTG-motif cell wall-anchored protein